MSVLFKFVYGVSFQFRQFIITWRGTFSLKPDWISFPGNRWIQEKCFHSSYLAKNNGHGGMESSLNNDKRKICNPLSCSLSRVLDMSQNSPVHRFKQCTFWFSNVGVELLFHNSIKQAITNMKYLLRPDSGLPDSCVTFGRSLNCHEPRFLILSSVWHVLKDSLIPFGFNGFGFWRPSFHDCSFNSMLYLNTWVSIYIFQATFSMSAGFLQ